MFIFYLSCLVDLILPFGYGYLFSVVFARVHPEEHRNHTRACDRHVLRSSTISTTQYLELVLSLCFASLRELLRASVCAV